MTIIEELARQYLNIEELLKPSLKPVAENAIGTVLGTAAFCVLVWWFGRRSRTATGTQTPEANESDLPKAEWFRHYLGEFREAADLDGTKWGFYGRKWLFTKFDLWRNSPGLRAVRIVGDYGTGKTAIIAELVLNPANPLHKNVNVLAWHCCRHRMPDWVNAGWMIGNLAAQLAEKLPEYKGKLNDPNDPAVKKELGRRNDQGFAYTALVTGILEPLCQIQPPPVGVCFLLIDALDESVDNRGPEPVSEIIQLLIDVETKLPQWLRLVVTTRSDKWIERKLAGWIRQPIDATSPDNLDDLRKCVEQRLKSGQFQQRLIESRKKVNEVVNSLVSKSEGLFIYVVMVLEAVDKAQLTFTRLHELPPGMDALYEEFFKRLFPTDALYLSALPVVQALVARVGPLNREQLVACFDLVHKQQVFDSLEKLSQFTVDRSECEFNHKSLYDWLSNRDRSLVFFADPQMGHDHFANWAVSVSEPYRNDSTKSFKGRDSYWYQHGVFHLIEVGRVADAIELLFWKDQIEKKSPNSGKVGTHQELGMIVAAIAAADEKGTPVDMHEDDAVDAKNLWGLFHTSYATDDMERIIGWIGHTQGGKEWHELVPMFLGTEDYVVRYAAACGQARRFKKLIATDKTRERAENEISELFNSDINHREMACYTIAELAKTDDERSTPWLTGQLEQLSNFPFYFARSALGDVLIDWSLNGHHDELNRLKIHENYWKPRWPYLEIDIIALAAIRPLNDAMLKSWGLNAYGDRIAKDRKFFKTANGWKNELLGKFVPSSKLWNLIENHFSSKVGDKTNPGTWPEMQALFRDDAPNGDDAFTLMRFLFSHPQWSGAERASAMLKHLATLPECRIRVFGVVDQFLSSKLKLNWRIVAGALDSTCLFCDIDDDETVRKPDNDKIGRPPKTERRRFEKNLLKKCYFAHPCCRVRSICAENFVADLLARNPSEWKSRLVDFEKPVLRWLADDDCWVLEHMYRLFHKPVHSLSKINDDDCNRSDPMKDELIAWMKERFVNLNPKSLLKKIGTGWHMSDREKFLANLERCREEKPKSS